MDQSVRVEDEVRQLHRFFQDWYRGELDDAAFERFESVLAEDFEIIVPDARILPRQSIIEAVRSQRGSDPDARLWIEDVRVSHVGEGVVIATYEEWQELGGNPARGRRSTVVFRHENTAPNGLVWLHVHETWLPEGV